MRKGHDFFTAYSLISIANKCYNRKKSPLEELFYRDSVRGCMKRIALNNTRNIFDPKNSYNSEIRVQYTPKLILHL
jgi:hypothetical protein